MELRQEENSGELWKKTNPDARAATPNTADLESIVKNLSSRNNAQRIEAETRLLELGPESVNTLIKTFGTQIQKQRIELIVKQLSHRNKAIRTEAEKRLATLGPECADDLLCVLEEEGKKYRKQKCNKRWGLYVFGSFVLVYITLGLYMGLSSGHWSLFSNLGSFGGSFAALGAAAALAPQYKSLLITIAELEDKRSVGWLVDALDTQDKEFNKTVEDTLIKLLPRLTYEESALLDAERRRILDRKLTKTHRSDLASAILAAYQTLGDSHSLDSVETMASGKATVKQTEVRDAAAAASEAIRDRLAAEMASQTLLRATVSPAEPMETLLRPAEGMGSESPSQLLRPAQESDGNTEALLLQTSNLNNPQ